jgi:hypothetical protein
MGTKRALQEVDPLSLPVGQQVGRWRVKGWGGRGAYGTLYRVERAGRAQEGEFALKLATHPGDERFGREAHLLRRIESPYVPRFVEQGEWKHPSGAYPYVVMEWVTGEGLYEWAARRNPSSRQVLRVLGQVTRALVATHEAQGVHRDVKGANVLVQPGDGRAFLTDFGAGHYRGAATLTSKVLPPGTGNYRTPEAWDFLRVFSRHPTAHYPASACDDLFALGVMAYRLVTDEYPPPTQPGELGAEVWCGGGPGAPPVRQLNPRVSPALGAIISRLLARAPVERFGGKARRAAEAMEHAVEAEGAEADEPLFTWANEHRPRLRSPVEVRLAEEQDAAARKEHALGEVEARARAGTGSKRALSGAFTRGRRVAVVVVGLLMAGLTVAVLYRGSKWARSVTRTEANERGSVAVGDSSSTAPAQPGTSQPQDSKRVVALPLPEKPLPGQSKPPCKRTGDAEIRGGCWLRLADARPPCKEEGKEDAYEWKGACYAPSYPSGREPTSSPP